MAPNKKHDAAAKRRKEALEKKRAYEFMMQDAAKSGLSPKHVKRLGWEAYTEDECVAAGLPFRSAGYKITYRDTSGKVLNNFRLKNQFTECQSGFSKGSEIPKYQNPPDAPPEAFFPHVDDTDWEETEKNPTIAIGVCEGEKKSVKLTLDTLPTVGLAGVFNFQSKNHGFELLPALERFVWTKRDVYIIFDSDIHSNRNVRMAANRLARLLTERGANVHIVLIPEHDEEKLGADDFIVRYGPPALKALIEKAVVWDDMRGLLTLDAEILYVQKPSSILILPTEESSSIDLIPVHVAQNERFADRFCKAEDGKLVAAFPLWFKHHRRSVKGLVYCPGGPDIIKGMKNMWTGWAFMPIAGDITLWTELLDFIFKDASPSFRKWVEMWIAWPIQHPGDKMYVALVLWSIARGTGKTLLGMLIAKLYGSHAIELNQANLTARFNALYTTDKSFVLGAEMLGDEGRKSSDALKHLLTGHKVTAEQKFIPAFEVENHMNFMMTSNHPNPVYAGKGERRFAVHEIKGSPMPDSRYKPYDEWLNSSVEDDRWSPAVMHHLLNLDTSTFNPRARAPDTEGLAQMIEAGRTQIESWVHELRVNPDGLPIDSNSHLRTIHSLHTALELLMMFGEGKHHTPKSLTLALRADGFAMACNGEPIRLKNGDRPRLWIVRDEERLSQMTAREIAELYDFERIPKKKSPSKFKKRLP